MEQVEDRTIRQLQAQLHIWRQRNFPTTWEDRKLQLLGVVEEVGELSHTILKRAQGIREGGDTLQSAIDERDAVADIVIFLMGYCSAANISMQEVVEAVADSVMERDWIKYPTNGRSPVYPERGAEVPK